MTVTIQGRFEDADGERTQRLQVARDCAALTIPDVLPELGQQPGPEILRPYQSLGSDGVANLVSKLLVALFPAGHFWFRHKPSARLQADQTVAADAGEGFDDKLYARDLIVTAAMEATNFRTGMRGLLEDVIVVGSALGRVKNDFGIQQFRFDHFVQKRASAGHLLWLITKESKDRLELDDEIIRQAGIKDPKSDRKLDLYTLAEWQRESKTWVIRQEMNKNHVGQVSEETVTPYVSVGYKELPGEDYSRSFVEERLPDLRSFNGLSLAVLDGAVAAAKLIPVFDPTKGWNKSDFTKPNGEWIAGRCTGNTPDGIGLVRIEKNNDFGFVINEKDRIEKRLAKQMLLESVAQPTGERVTATQVMRVAAELEGALGGVYSQIATELQKPYLARFIHQMEAKNLLVAIPANLQGASDVNILTGIAAISQKAELDKLLAGLQTVSQIPGGLERVELGEATIRILQGLNIDTVGLLKSDDKMKQEQAQRAQQEAAAIATQEAAKSAGKVVEIQAEAAANQ